MTNKNIILQWEKKMPIIKETFTIIKRKGSLSEH